MQTSVAMSSPTGERLTPAQLQFLAWLRKFNPVAYRVGIAAASRASGSSTQLAGLGSWWGSLTSAVGSIGSSVASAAKTILPGLMQYQTQRKLMNLQIARANQGLAPLNMSQLTLPALQVQVAPSPEITASLSRAVTAGTKKTWLYVAGAVVLVGGLWLVLRRR